MEILKKTKDLLASLADVTEAGSRIARFKIEVANLDRKTGLACRRIGEKVFQLWKGGDDTVLEDETVRNAIGEIVKIRDRIEVIHEELQEAKDKARAELDRAKKAVKVEADKDKKAVKKMAEKAAHLIKEETSRASAALKKKKSKSPSKKKAPKKASKARG